MRIGTSTFRMFQHVPTTRPMSSARMAFVAMSTALIPTRHTSSTSTMCLFTATTRTKCTTMESAVVWLQTTYKKWKRTVLKKISIRNIVLLYIKTYFNRLILDVNTKRQFSWYIRYKTDQICAITAIQNTNRHHRLGNASVAVVDFRCYQFTTTL